MANDMISIPQVEYDKLLRIKSALDAGECKDVSAFHGQINGSPIADGEKFIRGLQSFTAGDRVVIVKVLSLP